MNDINFTDDKLREMLRKATVAEPSANFTDTLMQRLPTSKPASQLSHITRLQWVIISIIAFAVFCGLCYSAVVIFNINLKNWFTVNLSALSDIVTVIAKPFKLLSEWGTIPHYSITAGVAALVLLTADLLIRRHLFNKQQTH